ncbi:MAG TPA: FGGY-family carbohydrate kinase [Edaphobacter sp.]|jgi:xylulokinase
MAVIAIDAGTSVIKAVAFAEDGRELALARTSTEVLHPMPDCSEQSMPGVWNAVQSTVREVARTLDEPVALICITAQGDGCWLIDEHGNPTGNAMLWNDGRGKGVVERWGAEGALTRAMGTSGSMTYPGLCNAQLEWLRGEDPERLNRSRWVLTCNGWLFLKLTGRIAMEISDASNPFGDAQTRAYSDEVFAAFGLEQYREMFPEIVSGSELQASLTDRAAKELSLPTGIPVVMTPYDIVTTAYGAGVVSPGEACLILGTTICAEAIIDKINLDAPGTATLLALEEGLSMRAMPTLAGCETLEWAARILGAHDLDALEKLAQSSEIESNGVLFLPYLSEAGERSPFLDPLASGSWQGLKLSHRREQMARAVYEGLSFVIRECLEAAASDIHELRVCGGGSRSAFWCQLIANVTGLRVLRSTEREVGARGAYLFGRFITGRYKSLAQGVKDQPLSFDCFTPEPEATAIYSRTYKQFLMARGSQRSWLADRQATEGTRQ